MRNFYPKKLHWQRILQTHSCIFTFKWIYFESLLIIVTHLFLLHETWSWRTMYGNDLVFVFFCPCTKLLTVPHDQLQTKLLLAFGQKEKLSLYYSFYNRNQTRKKRSFLFSALLVTSDDDGKVPKSEKRIFWFLKT